MRHNENGNPSTATNLSSLKIKKFTYPGWKGDYFYIQHHMTRAVDSHFSSLSDLHHNMFILPFRDRLLGMINQQRLFNGDRRHEQIVQLDSLCQFLSYPGWKYDVEHAERVHIRFPSLFNDEIVFLVKKQRLFEEDAFGSVCDGDETIRFSIDRHNRMIGSVKATKDSSVKETAKEIMFKVTRASREKTLENPPNESESALQNSSCIVCLQSKREYAFVPCGHLCICRDCSVCIANLDSRCPLCRCNATHVMKIFS